ncbi:hypothetical protein CYMTET_27675 [Cymbomonas tetramitiformis]|uniref:Uncharacterized protein n=1 Tax=Cymbomonas tetramitiformis TaxID=36881 RepID=A0AAE0FPA7_9CHLO|nr:hypothetical protein CYMTET_27675 [Cymbomonas tetramitiformis]
MGEEEEEEEGRIGSAPLLDVHLRVWSYIECLDEPPDLEYHEAASKRSLSWASAGLERLGLREEKWRRSVGRLLNQHGVRFCPASRDSAWENGDLRAVHQELGIEALSRTLRPAWLVFRGGMRLRVHLHEQKTLEDEGRTVIVPVTRLDNAVRVLGSFFDSYEGQYFWWQCWEMTRRLLQNKAVRSLHFLTRVFDKETDMNEDEPKVEQNKLASSIINAYVINA